MQPSSDSDKVHIVDSVTLTFILRFDVFEGFQGAGVAGEGDFEVSKAKQWKQKMWSRKVGERRQA